MKTIFLSLQRANTRFNKPYKEVSIFLNSHPKKKEKYLLRKCSYFKAPGKEEVERTLLGYMLGQGCSFSGRRERANETENREDNKTPKTPNNST